jgi:hypothetical protein
VPDAQKARPARPQGVRRLKRTLAVRQGDERLRTPHGKRRVLTRQGWAGEKSDFFSIQLGFFLPEEKRSIPSRYGDGDEFDRQQQSAHDGIGRRWVQDEMEAEKFWSL